MLKSVFITLILFVVGLNIILADNLSDPEKSEKAKTTVIEGKVLDNTTSEELVCATVILNGTGEEVCTDVNGYFRFEGIEPGKYEITVKYISYKNEVLSNIRVKPGKTETIEVYLNSL